MKKSSLIVGIIGAIILVLIAVLIFYAFRDKDDVANYQQCVDRGYPVQETEPRSCVTPDGQTFIVPDASQNGNQTPVNENGNDQNGNQTPANQNGNDQQRSDRNEQQEALSLAVYFSERSESADDFSNTVAVDRTTTRVDVGTFAIEQLIAGPSAAEQERGLYSPIRGNLEGESNCDGQDFSLAVQDGTARLQFCRSVVTAGIGEDARIRSTIEDTLMQFSTVGEVVILNRNGNQFGNLQ